MNSLPRIEDWHLEKVGDKYIIKGFVYGDKFHKDGAKFKDEVNVIDFTQGYVDTTYDIYALGEMA